MWCNRIFVLYLFWKSLDSASAAVIVYWQREEFTVVSKKRVMISTVAKLFFGLAAGETLRLRTERNATLPEHGYGWSWIRKRSHPTLGDIRSADCWQIVFSRNSRQVWDFQFDLEYGFVKYACRLIMHSGYFQLLVKSLVISVEFFSVGQE